ncbi:SGNH/GDSL hydrolase family protein [soil metagenome]
MSEAAPHSKITNRLRTHRFLALGDSYTIGEGVEASGRWPAQLVDLLRGSGHHIEDPEIIARTGWTTDELLRGIQEARPAGPYDLVSLLIGVNNQYRGSPSDLYAQEFGELLEGAIKLVGGDPRHVMVLSIPDWSVTPFAAEHDTSRIASEVDEFNAINRAAAQLYGTVYVDVTPSSRSAAGREDLLAADHLHPSADMYSEWARLAHTVAAEALGNGYSPSTDEPHSPARSR